MWSRVKFLNAFDWALQDLNETVQRKNDDYAGDGDPFANFQLIEHLTAGRLSGEDGILVRMSDKITRLSNLMTRGPQVEESFEDTAYDLAAYSIILTLLRRSRTEPDDLAGAPTEAPPPPVEGPSAMDKLRAMIQGMLQQAPAAEAQA